MKIILIILAAALWLALPCASCFADTPASAEEASTPDQKPVKYAANRNTIICHRTTDFDAAQEAVNQLDMQWFATNPSCRFIKKGRERVFNESGFPIFKFLFRNR
jgi:hypothetical protein